MSPDPRLKTHEELKAAREIRRALKLKTPMKKVNKERGGQRVVEGRDPDYLAWVEKQPDIILGLTTGWHSNVTLNGYWYARVFIRVVAAHCRHGRTAGCDETALPVIWELHDEQHNIGIKTWAKKYALDLPALIAAHRKRYALECAAASRRIS